MRRANVVAKRERPQDLWTSFITRVCRMMIIFSVIQVGLNSMVIAVAQKSFLYLGDLFFKENLKSSGVEHHQTNMAGHQATIARNILGLELMDYCGISRPFFFSFTSSQEMDFYYFLNGKKKMLKGFVACLNWLVPFIAQRILQ